MKLESVKPRISKQLLGGLFNPEFIPANIQLNDLVREGIAVERTEAAQTSVINRVENPTPKTLGQIPVPLTEAEATEADKLIEQTTLRVQALKQKLIDTRSQLQQAVNTANNGKELSFDVDVSKKPRVRRALRKLYGQDLKNITYSMYVEMLEAKHTLETQEVDKYSKGITK